jgi:hypothetical protein
MRPWAARSELLGIATRLKDTRTAFVASLVHRLRVIEFNKLVPALSQFVDLSDDPSKYTSTVAMKNT